MFNSSYPHSLGCITSCHALAKALKNSVHKLWDFRTSPVRSRLAGVVFFIFGIVFSLSSCAKHPAPRFAQMQSYRAFLDSTSRISKITPESLPQIIIRWKRLENSLFEIIRQDSMNYDTNYDDITKMALYGDSLTRVISSSIDRQQISYKQLLNIQSQIAQSFADISLEDDDVRLATSFYENSSITSNTYSSVADIERDYLNFLDESSSRDFQNWNDIEDCLRDEHKFFECYTAMIFNHSQTMTGEIIEATERLAERMSEAAITNRIEAKKLLVYMTVRTNMRLIHCAKASMNTTLSVNIQNMREASFCVSSFMAPFLHFNHNIIASRTPKQNQILATIGSKTSQAFETLESQNLVLISAPDSLPNKILKDYITYVLNY